jgi:uncharacterized protein YeaO (DUF488 family)
MTRQTTLLLLGLIAGWIVPLSLPAQNISDKTPQKWVTVTEQAAGTSQKSKDEAIAKALRRAVEEGCGTFLKAQSQSKNYKGVYDKVFADAVGYVKEHKVLKTWIEDDCYHARVRALISTQKFEKDWSVIAHTYHQEDNPRVIIAIGETTYEMVNEMHTEKKTATDVKAVVVAESEYRADVARAAAAAREGTAYTVQGNYSWWSGRPRPRQWATMSGEQRAAWVQATSAKEVRTGQVTFTGTSRTSSDTKVWKHLATAIEEKGAVQGRIEEFFLDKGIKLVDRSTAKTVNKRDLMLAASRENLAEVAALGAKFHADVIILGSAAAKYSRELTVGEAKMYQYTSKLVIRVIRTDSGQLIASKVFGPYVSTSLQKSGGEAKALDKLAEKAAPKLLAAVVEAWRKQVQVTRDIRLLVTGMTYGDWKKFKTEAEKLRGVKAVRLREITESVANIDVDYEFNTQNLADNLTELKGVKLEVTEFNPNRIKLKLVK